MQASKNTKTKASMLAKTLFLFSVLLSCTNTNISGIIEKYFSFGLNKVYNNIESIHTCIETVKNDYLYEPCTKNAFIQLEEYIINNNNYNHIRSHMTTLNNNRNDCLLKNELATDKCYAVPYNEITQFIMSTSDVNLYKQKLVE